MQNPWRNRWIRSPLTGCVGFLARWRKPMPSKPARPCMVRSCPNRIKGDIAYCPKHAHLAPTGWQMKRNTEHQPFYNSRAWRKTSQLYRKQHPLCESGEHDGIAVPVDVVDHKVPIQDGGEKFDWDNLQSLCHSCHSKKTKQESINRKHS